MDLHINVKSVNPALKAKIVTVEAERRTRDKMNAEVKMLCRIIDVGKDYFTFMNLEKNLPKEEIFSLREYKLETLKLKVISVFDGEVVHVNTESKDSEVEALTKEIEKLNAVIQGLNESVKAQTTKIVMRGDS